MDGALRHLQMLAEEVVRASPGGSVVQVMVVVVSAVARRRHCQSHPTHYLSRRFRHPTNYVQVNTRT